MIANGEEPECDHLGAPGAWQVDCLVDELWDHLAVDIIFVELDGRVKSTFLRGALIYDNGNVVGPAKGQYLRRPIIK